MAKNRLQEKYRNEVAPALMEEFGYESVMQVPRISKVVINIGVGEALDNAKALDGAVEDVRRITGQQPVITKARKSVAAFKLREGRAIGVKVDLRGERMWSLLDRLMNVALPVPVTSAGSARTRSMVAATTRSVCASSCCSRRSSTTRSTRCAAWRSRS